jgi:large subunit ribosomal protein L25
VYDLEVEYEIKMAEQQTLVTVVAPHLEPVLVEEEEAEEELEEGEEPAEGEEAVEGEEGAEGEGPQPGAAPGEVPPEA